MSFLLSFAILLSAASCILPTVYTQIEIVGNELPLINGVQQDITCIYGGSDVAAIQWILLIGTLEIPYRRDISGANELVLNLQPTPDLDQSQFMCRVIDFLGRKVEEIITITVKDLEHSLNITASNNDTVLAGTVLTLTCTAVSDRPTHLYWIDPNGLIITSGDYIIVENDANDEITLTFNTVKTSHAGNYSCNCTIDNPATTEISSYMLSVKIPEPTLAILRDPILPLQLFTTDSLVLTCVIELIPEVDTYVNIHSQWRGHSSLTENENRVIVSDLEGLKLMYNTSVTFYSLQSSDSGSYVCSATVSPVIDNDIVIDSLPSVEEINISIVLRVEIEVTYDPPFDFTLPSPPYYRPATSVTLTCQVHGATGTVSYQWSSTCSSCFASSSTSHTISDSVLQSNDAGVHTCTAVDGNSNNGSNSTEMRLIGAGIYVHHSQYFASTSGAVANNSLIVLKPYTCSYCRIYLDCYSNSTLQSVGYFLFSNGARLHSNTDYYDYNINRLTNSGIRLRSYSTSTPDLFGIFTCELPDSEGNTVETSIGIYSSTPNAPSVYSIKYVDWSENSDFDVLGTIECLTQYSPPTNVTWLRDGVPVQVDGEGYEMMQIVIDRPNSRYNNTLIIRNAIHLAGDHQYNCTIDNRAGTTTSSIATTLSTYPDIDISVSGEALYSMPFNITCKASLNPKLAEQLIGFVKLEWVYNTSQVSGDGVTVEQQYTSQSSTSLSLIFNPLNMSHGGNYVCKAELMLPDSPQSFHTTELYHLNVLNRTIFQLMFGPVVHCSKWYEDKKIADHLEQDIKRTMTSVFNEKCDCNFQEAFIDQGEFSCRTLPEGFIIYRARLQGSNDTLDIPNLLSLVKGWMECDGTFLSTYHGRIRLGVDPVCPVEIEKFSEPECQGSREGPL